MYEAGDLVRYKFKNELGKIKRLNPHMKDCAFVWYHCGDTAACTGFDLISLVLSKEEVDKYTTEELLTKLENMEFSNAYAIEEIIKKKEEKENE